MKKTIFLIILTGIIAIFVLYNFISNKQNDASSALEQKTNQQLEEDEDLQNKPDQFPEEKEKTPSPPQTQSSIESINDSWNQYENYDLGFKIKYPKKNGNKNVEIIEEDHVIYISDGMYDEEINKKKNDSIFDKAIGIPFAILIQDASNDDELEHFIQKRYGDNCLLGEKKETEKNNMFDITIDAGNWNPEDPDSCFVNYMTVIKYDVTKGKVASWDIGQAVNFMLDNKPIDQEISDSFEFLH